jgi:hypothetical protein
VAGLTVFVLTILVSAGAEAQESVTFDRLLQELGRGDRVSIVKVDGAGLEGAFRATRLEDKAFEIVPITPGAPPTLLPFDSIRSVERRRDSLKDGTLIGFGVGAGVIMVPFVVAIAIDANEMDEWLPGYLAAFAVSGGVGALIGARIDAAHSKPHVRYEAPSAAGAPVTIAVGPFVTGSRTGVALTLRF